MKQRTQPTPGFDLLRAGLMLAGVFFHALLAYLKKPVPYWPVFDADHARGAEVFVLYLHAFRMPLFFFLSGLLTDAGMRRRGARLFVARRLHRLGLPLLIGATFIAPSLLLIALCGREGAIEALGVYAHHPDLRGASAFTAVTTLVRSGEALSLLRPAHLWFLVYLMAFTALSPAVRILAQGRALPSFAVVALPTAMLVVSRAPFFIDAPDTWIPLPHVFAYYATYFYWGFLRPSTTASHRAGIGVAHVCFLAYAGLVAYLVEHPGSAAVRALAMTALAVAVERLVPGVIRLARDARIQLGPRLVALSRASYWIYLVHLVPLILCQRVLADFAMPGLLKAWLAALFAGSSSFVVFHFGLRSTALGRLLEGRSQSSSRPD